MRLGIIWRLAAFLALLVFALIFISLARLFLHNLGLTIVIGLTSTLLLYAVLQFILGTKTRPAGGIWLVVGLLSALVVEFGIFLIYKKNLKAVIGLAMLALAYVAILGLLRKKYWSEVRRAGENAKLNAHFKKPYLIINPKSGNGRAIKAHVDVLAQEMGVKVLVMKKEDRLENLAAKAIGGGADVLGISGGDGSIGTIAKLALENGLPIVVLPGGTRCHFARDLGLDPKRIADALEGFNGVERRIDVADINGRIFLNNASFGLYADIVNHPDYRDNKAAVTREVLRSIVSGEKDLYDLSFNYGKRKFKKAAQVLVGVNSYNTIDLFEMGHREQLDGGVLQITAVTLLNDTVAKKLLESISKGLVRRSTMPEGIYQWTNKSFILSSPSKTVAVGVDGESEDYSSPITIRIMPGALRVYVPPEGVRNRPKNPFSAFVLRRIWRTVVYPDSS
jgi:diacylglycerol kinase family enzyme